MEYNLVFLRLGCIDFLPTMHICISYTTFLKTNTVMIASKESCITEDATLYGNDLSEIYDFSFDQIVEESIQVSTCKSNTSTLDKTISTIENDSKYLEKAWRQLLMN